MGRRSVILLALALGMTACVRADEPRVATDGQQAPPTGPKVVTIAIQREPSMFVRELAVGYGASGGVSNLYPIVHDRLTVEDEITGARIPHLAVELPSTEKGAWCLNPDGTMEMTWKLHQNVKWHDGAPFTAADIAFSFGVFKDPAIPNTIGRELQLMDGVETPDP